MIACSYAYTNSLYTWLYTISDKILATVLLAKCIEKHFGKINIGDLDEM